MTATKGWDYFIADPDTISTVDCKVCGTTMTGIRNISSPTSWVERMAKIDRLHDAFYCPYANQIWHSDVLALKQEAEKTVSKKIKQIILDEAKELLDASGPKHNPIEQ